MASLGQKDPKAYPPRSGNLRFAADAVVQARREGFITQIESRRLTKELKKLHDARAA